MGEVSVESVEKARGLGFGVLGMECNWPSRSLMAAFRRKGCTIAASEPAARGILMLAERPKNKLRIIPPKVWS